MPTRRSATTTAKSEARASDSEGVPQRKIRPRKAEMTQRFKVPGVPTRRLAKLQISASTSPDKSASSSQLLEDGRMLVKKPTPLLARNTVSNATTSAPVTPRRTCKEQAMIKILKCFEQLSTDPKKGHTTIYGARRHTEKTCPTSLSRRKNPRTLSSDESSSSPSQSDSSLEEFVSEETTSSDENLTFSSASTDESDHVRSRSSKARRRTTKRKTHFVDQVLVPRRTIGKIDRQTLNAKLHASHLSIDSLPCREREFDTIFEFLFEHLQNRIGGCLYISGVPGTGKTATVMAVVKNMTECMNVGGDDGEGGVIPSFTFVTVNGMQVSEPRQLYVRLYEALTGIKVSVQKAISLLEAEFCSPPRNKCGPTVPACILFLDELDLLCSRRQDVLYALFDWTCRTAVGRRPLIVLAVANTMDLPERVLHHRVASRLGLNRLAFTPYSHEQLASIVTAQLGTELSTSFDPKAIELVTRKVAAVSGDARRALDICRRAAELSQEERDHGIIVTMQHVNAALREMFTSPVLTALRCVSHYERLLLRALVAEAASRGVEEVRLIHCLQQLYALCSLEGVPPPTDTEVFGMCAALGAYKLILTEPSRRDTNMLLRLNCTQSDVLFALKTA